MNGVIKNIACDLNYSVRWRQIRHKETFIAVNSLQEQHKLHLPGDNQKANYLSKASGTKDSSSSLCQFYP